MWTHEIQVCGLADTISAAIKGKLWQLEVQSMGPRVPKGRASQHPDLEVIWSVRMCSKQEGQDVLIRGGFCRRHQHMTGKACK